MHRFNKALQRQNYAENMTDMSHVNHWPLIISLSVSPERSVSTLSIRCPLLVRQSLLSYFSNVPT